MIVDHVRGWGFVHIPRTGGNAVTEALAEICPDAEIRKGLEFHAPLRLTLERYPEWRNYRWFANIRRPWAIMESRWRLCTYEASINLDHGYLNIQELVKDGFPEFVRRLYLYGPERLVPGGFWKTYCCWLGGAEIGVHPVRYSHLQADFDKMCRLLGVESRPLNVVRHIPGETPEWPSELLKQVMERCRYDLLEPFY
jgi:hypothetical protein